MFNKYNQITERIDIGPSLNVDVNKENINKTRFTYSHCGAEITYFEGNCPNCGKSLKNNNGIKALGIGVVGIALVILIPVIVVVLYVFLVMLLR